jgi:GxxExxY protein
MGVLFEVYNALGYGYQEKYYQRAIALALKNCKLSFREQVPAKVKFQGEVIARVLFDFLIEDKMVLEIKKSDRFSKTEISQLHGYLKASGLKLGILVHFTKDGIKYKRILNL